MNKPVSTVFTFDHYKFTEVILECLSCLVSAENTCTFNNNKLFKKFKEKIMQWLQQLLHVYLHRFMRKWKLLPSKPGCGLYFPPRRASEVPMERVPRGGNFQGGGVRFSRSFFLGTLKQELLFLLMILHLTVIAECFFHSLPVWL